MPLNPQIPHGQLRYLKTLANETVGFIKIVSMNLQAPTEPLSFVLLEPYLVHDNLEILDFQLS